MTRTELNGAAAIVAIVTGLASAGSIGAQDLAVPRTDIANGTLEVNVSGMPNAGFVVVHSAAEGGGPSVPAAIGHAAVSAGGQDTVRVPISGSVAAGDTLFVMLHGDDGRSGVYEFGPGATDVDTPLVRDGGPVLAEMTVGEVTARQAPALSGAQPISATDRVYTADQSSNTITVVNPATQQVLGTISLGAQRIERNMAPVDPRQENVHGLGFARDGSALIVVSVQSNAVQVIDPQTNEITTTTYVGRSPHEAFASPDGQTIWTAIRGEDYVSVIDRDSGEVLDRVATAAGPSKVVFSPDGTRAYVNHLFAQKLFVIDTATRGVIGTVDIPEQAGGSADLAATPDGAEVWLGHPGTGHITVIDARDLSVRAVIETGPRTNHPNFITRDEVDYAYVTVGGLNETKIFRRGDGVPELMGTISHQGVAPHGIWPSPDGSRIYIVLQKSDAMDIVDTATNEVIDTLSVGQDPQALIYVANAVPEGDGIAGLGQQGLGGRVENLPVEVRGAEGAIGAANIRRVAGVDEIDVTARGLPPGKDFTVFAINDDAAHPIRTISAGDNGVVGESLAYADFFGTYDRLILMPAGERP